MRNFFRKILKIIMVNLLFSLIIFGLVINPGFAQPSGLTPEEILDKIDDLYRGESSQGTMTMKITTEHWSRTLEMEYWSMGKEKSLFRILSPKKEKGYTTLKSGNDIWNYLPKVKKTIKLPSSMMSQSWNGSHFTNDDLVKESRFTDDYTFEITFDGTREGRNIVEIKCTPHEDAAVVWGKVVVVVDNQTFIPLEILYYDEDLDLARTLIFYDVQTINDRELPVSMKVIPADKPNELTEITYNEILFNIEIDEGFFSIRNLEG